MLSTTLNDEILTEIRVPKASADSGAAFVEISRRRGDFALAGVGAQVTMDGDTSRPFNWPHVVSAWSRAPLTEAESVLATTR